uniref:Myosin heavy chain-related family protein n=2 Tax=Rhizophora mucronata TaxID=61149 RepID=A0A2P2KRM6_RHIMU
MEAHHASLGRRTLQEIRQKRAAERFFQASSGSDLSKVEIPNDNVGMRKSESGNRLSEVPFLFQFLRIASTLNILHMIKIEIEISVFVLNLNGTLGMCFHPNDFLRNKCCV